MMNRSSLERPSSSRSKRASLRNSIPLDDAHFYGYMYEQERAPNDGVYQQQQRPHSQHSAQHRLSGSAFPPVETDLDEDNPGDLHMVDAGALLSPHHQMTDKESDIFAEAHLRGQSLGMSTEEEAALYDSHLEDEEKYVLAQSEDEYMRMIGPEDGHHRQIGLYGWRKKMTYLILAVIVLFVAINAALTFWIISFLGLSSVRLICFLHFLIHTLYRMAFPV